MARWAKESGYRTFYYISPKFWAWNEGRVKKVKEYVDRMFIIFPFEVDFYRKHGVEVKYAGNPLVDETSKRAASFPSREDICKSIGIANKPVIGMMAGSRKHEVETILPQMLKAVHHFPGYQFVLAAVKNIPDELYGKIIGSEPVVVVRDKTYEVLHISEAALIKSGTSTLEAALHGTPQVVCYKGDFLSMLIGWMVIKVKYISLVNLIMDSEVVKELVQYDLTEKKITEELNAILPGGDKRSSILSGYEALKEKLGPAGASGRIAAEMVRELRLNYGTE
jgi:lipid-A-disaccharide synthase